jgi:hypothetical protein
MNFPMKVLCIDSKGVEDSLKVGKVYTAIRESWDGGFFKGRFKPLTKVTVGWAVRVTYKDGSKNYVDSDNRLYRHIFESRSSAASVAKRGSERGDGRYAGIAKVVRVVRWVK